MRLVLRAVSSVLYSSLALGLKACTATARFLWHTSVANGIKGVCVTTVWSVKLTSVAVLLSDLQASFIY